MRKRVVVTGLGCISALGTNARTTWERIRDGKSGITRRRVNFAGEESLSFDGPMAYVEAGEFGELPISLDRRYLAHLDKISLLAVLASSEALDDAGLLAHPVLERNTSIVFGAAGAGANTVEGTYHRLFASRSTRVSPLTIPKAMVSAPASAISMSFGVGGPAFVISSACASSSHAVAEGAHMIRSGRVSAAIVGGSEAAITYGFWQSWKALGVMATTACRPFSADREGLVLGEGAATLLLEEYEHAALRGARIYAEILGIGASSDAHHITQPCHHGALRALEAAHEDARLALDVSTIINAHGTGTVLNDRVEALVMRTLYGDNVKAHHVTATKAAHGHLVGASGALELLLTILSLRERIAPPVLNFKSPEPECNLNLVTGGAREVSCRTAISNTFAFGGLNSAIIVGRA